MAKSTKPGRILVCIAAAVALFVAAGPPAQAGNWGGKFDPPQMHGTDLFNLSGSACLPDSNLLDGPVTFLYVNGFDVNNCVVSLLNASVTLTDPSTTDTANLTFVDAGSLNSGQIWGIDLAPDGTLLGVDSFLIGPQFAPFGSNAVFNGPWWIQFDAQDGKAPPASNIFAIDPPPLNVVNLFGGFCDGNCVPDTGNPPAYIANLEGNQFVAVPEPGSLALLAVALGVGWLTRRRKAAA